MMMSHFIEGKKKDSVNNEKECSGKAFLLLIFYCRVKQYPNFDLYNFQCIILIIRIWHLYCDICINFIIEFNFEFLQLPQKKLFIDVYKSQKH